MTVRREIAQSQREAGARSREAGNTPPGSSEGGMTPSWRFYKGGGPLVRVGDAGSRPEPDCLDARPPRLRGRAPFAWSWREQRIPHWIL